MLLTRAFHYRPACWAHARRALVTKPNFSKYGRSGQAPGTNTL